MRISIGLFAIAAFAAQNATEQPKFEVASVKRAECSMENSIDPGMVTLKGFPLKAVLAEAFQVKMDQIEGPSWLDNECFDLIAKMPEGVGKDRMPAMLQALLADRFKLAAHMEDRPRNVYALVVDKGGPKFKESDPNAPNQRFLRFTFGGGGIKGSVTMAALARYLSGRGYGPVLDFTGLNGKYDIDLAWAPDPAFERSGPNAAVHPDPAPASAPTADLFHAIRESLGLKLEPRKEPVGVLVVDHVERVPTGN